MDLPQIPTSLVEKQFLGAAIGLFPLMQDEKVTDILVNGTSSLFIERDGLLSVEKNPFKDNRQVQDFIERLLIPIGKRIDAAHPYADGRLLDGSRFHVILPPIAVEGPFISIRKKRDTSHTQLESFGPPDLILWLKDQVVQKKNLLIAGSTGAGKTTLLCRLLEEAGPGERIAVIEETMEIQANHPHLIHMEARPPSPEGVGEVTLRTLLKNALRMRPDRIVVGECRGEEAFDMLQAMNTGHKGSLGTIHASSAADALKRIESLALLAGFQMPLKVVRDWVGSNLNTVVFIERIPEGRKITEVLSVHGLEGEVYRVTPRYNYRSKPLKA